MKKIIYISFLLVMFQNFTSYSQNFEIFKEGIGGNTSGQMLNRINSSVLSHNPTTTIILVGTNDIVNIPKLILIDQFEKNLRNMVSQILASNSKLILMTIPPVVESAWFDPSDLPLYAPEEPNGRIILYNDVIEQIALENNVIVVDTYNVFNNNKSLLSSDGVHPSDEGADRMTDLLYNALDQNGLPIDSLVCFGDSITKRYQDKLDVQLTENPIVSTNVTVPLGGNIQNSIDQVNANGGGVVTLASGTFTITSSLKIKSNVTLQGSGIFASTIKTTQNIKIIEQSGNGLENIIIRNLTLEGTNKINGGGMDIISYGTDHDTILISNIRCYNTGWGVHIKGAKNVTVENCDFSYNGTEGMESYAHNMYLRRVYGATVKNSSFNYSTSANGINISYSEDIEIYDCEMIGNYFRGVRAADSDGFLVHNCIVTDNGNVGILANTENVVTKNIDWQNNCSSNNLVGFETKNGATGEALNNNSYGNGDNYKIISGINQSNNITDSNMECGAETIVCKSHDAFSRIQAEDYCDESGIIHQETDIGHISNGDWIAFDSIDFGRGSTRIRASVASNGFGGTIQMRLGGVTGTLIGSLEVTNTGGWDSWETISAQISPVKEVQKVYFVFKGNSQSLFDVDWIEFTEDNNTLTTNYLKSISNQVISYPNPVLDRLHLHKSDTLLDDLEVCLFNLRGQILFANINITRDYTLDMDTLKSGIYLLKIKYKEQIETRKIMKN